MRTRKLGHAARLRREGTAAAGHGGNGRRPARIYREFAVRGAKYWTLLDSGSRGTYVTRVVADALGTRVRLARPVKRALGGRLYTIPEACGLAGTMDGYVVTAMAFVVDRLFKDEDGRPIEIILGMEALETWGIWLDTIGKQPDYRHYVREAHEG